MLGFKLIKNMHDFIKKTESKKHELIQIPAANSKTLVLKESGKNIFSKIFQDNRQNVAEINAKNKQSDEFEKKYPVIDLYSQNGITFETEFVKHSNHYSKSYYLTGIPRYLDPKQIMETFELNNKTLLSFEFNFTLKLSIENDKGLSTDRKIEMAKSAIQIETQAIKMLSKSETKASSEISDIISIEEKLADGQEINDISFILTIFARNEENLKMVDNQIQSKLKSRKWSFNSPFADQKGAFINSLPIPTKNGYKLKVLSEPVSMLFVPTNTRQSGVLPIGWDNYRNNIFFWDIFREGRAWSITITGKNGSGKSAMAKVLFEQLGLLGVQRYFIDPEGETLKLANQIGARIEHVNQQKGVNIVYFDEDIIKYFDEEDAKQFDPKKDHVLFMTEFFLKFPIFDQELKNNRSPMYLAFNDFYDGIGKDKEKRNIDELVKFTKIHDSKYGIYSAMVNFGFGGQYYNYVSSKDEFGLEEDAVIFITKGVPNEGVRAALGTALLMKVWEKMIRGGRYRALFVDELLMYIKDPYFRDLLIQYISRGRKYNAFFVVLTQELKHFKDNNALSILEQSGFDLIFQQKNISADIISLGQSQIEEIQKLTTGTCSVHVLGRDYLDKVSIHLREYQNIYCAKDGNHNLSIDLMSRYPKSNQTLGEIVN